MWWGKEGRDKFDHRQTRLSARRQARRPHLPLVSPGEARPGRRRRWSRAASDPGAHLSRPRHHLRVLPRGRAPRTVQGQGVHELPHPGELQARLALRSREDGLSPHRASRDVACDKCHAATGQGPARGRSGPSRSPRASARAATRTCTRVASARPARPATTRAACDSRTSPSSTTTARTIRLRGSTRLLLATSATSPVGPCAFPSASARDCHTDAHLGQLAKRADQGRCESCHDLAGFSPAKFTLEDHQKTSYALAGAHLAVPCDACHKTVGPDTLAKIPGVVVPANAGGRRTLQFRYAGTRCADCHKDPHRGELDARAGKDGCVSCHKVESWHQIAFDHAKTRFPLTGGHARVACAPCHPQADQGQADRDDPARRHAAPCEDCHKDPAPGPAQEGGERPSRAPTVTGPRAWSRTSFDHDRDAGFALDGAHVKLACAACHVRDAKAGLGASAVQAAAANLQGMPRRFDGGLERGQAMRRAAFSSHPRGPGPERPPLGGAPRPAQESPRHPGHRLRRVSQPEPLGARAGAAATSSTTRPASRSRVPMPRPPVGAATGASSSATWPPRAGTATRTPTTTSSAPQCEKCHTPRTWTNQREIFTAHNRTRFPLFAVHANVDCASCHPEPEPHRVREHAHHLRVLPPEGLPEGGQPEPRAVGLLHAVRGLPLRDRLGWRTTRFTDHSKTRFPLAGGHRSVTCDRCHPGGRFTGTSLECYACHQANYQGTTNPNHVAPGTSRAPATAATPSNGWRPASLTDHNRPGSPSPEPTRPWTAHAATWEAATRARPPTATRATRRTTRAPANPNHVAGNFPRTCEACHSTNAWRPASGIDHNKTRFPLTGAHQQVACARCHVGGRYGGTSTDCYSCHKTNYDGATNPNHRPRGSPPPASPATPRTAGGPRPSTTTRPASP